MKKLLVILSFLVTFSSYSQNDGLEICFQYQKSLKGFTTDKEAEDALNKILNVIGASRNFLLVPCDEISNALAITYKGERYILYDKSLLSKLEVLSNDWSSLFVLAHEVGHHINGHTRDFLISDKIDSQTFEEIREEELEADEFAGFVLANLGASINDINELFDIIGTKGDDTYSTHPNKDKRMAASKKGFDKYQPKVIVKTSNNSTKTPTPPPLVYSDIFKIYSTSSFASNAWRFEDYKPLNQRLNGTQLFGNGKKITDPFKVNEIKKDVPTDRRISSTIGKVFKADGIEKIELQITQKRYINKGGRYHRLYKNYSLTENEEKIRPYISVTISLRGYMDMPKYNLGALGWLPEMRMSENYQLMNDVGDKPLFGKLKFIIDDIYEGFFIVPLLGWELAPIYMSLKSGEYNEREYKRLEREGSDRLVFAEGTPKDEWHSYLVPMEIILNENNTERKNRLWDELLTIQSELNYNDKILLQNSISKEIQFLNALKRGKKLYLKMDNKLYNPKYGSWITDYKLDNPTMEFDLKGSSKALNFN